MKILVSYYSRSGNTKKVAEEIARQLKADLDEIVDLKKRKGVVNYIVSCFDAIKKKLTKIKYNKNPEKYKIVIIGSPVWAGTMAPAVRTYLIKNKFDKLGFFVTYGGKEGKIFSEMEKISKKPVAVLGVKKTDLSKVKEFIRKF